jgi:hypothetical protein
VRDDLANNIQIDIEIPVYKAVPDTCDLTPGDVWVLFPSRWGNLFGGLAKISINRTTARASISSESRSIRERPCMNETALRAASSMCRKRISSACDILNLGFSLNFVSEIGAQELSRLQVHFSTEDFGEFVLHRKKGESRCMPWLELH